MVSGSTVESAKLVLLLCVLARVERLPASGPLMTRYPVMFVSWGSSQVRVRLSWLTWEAARPVGAAGG